MLGGAREDDGLVSHMFKLSKRSLVWLIEKTVGCKVHGIRIKGITWWRVEIKKLFEEKRMLKKCVRRGQSEGEKE